MRIIHLSDIHLSSENLIELRTFYLKALISELQTFNSQIKIDIIVISGDLVDKGGKSLLKMDEFSSFSNPYLIFEKEFITPISLELKLNKDQFLFVPGNHDINRDEIEEISEAGLMSIIKSPEEANRIVNIINNKKFYHLNRQNDFKEFERQYYNSNYSMSPFESTYIHESSIKVGFGLINDSWRCSENLKLENHFFGTTQLKKIENEFDIKKCNIYILVIHHSIDSFNKYEKQAINNILLSGKISILLSGHEHSNRVIESNDGQNKYLNIRGRTAFNKPGEIISEFQPGYNIVDIDNLNFKTKVTFRKYMNERYVFDYDLEKNNQENEFEIDFFNMSNMISLQDDIAFFTPLNTKIENGE